MNHIETAHSFPEIMVLHQPNIFMLTPLTIPIDLSATNIDEILEDYVHYFGGWLANDSNPKPQWRIIQPILLDLPYAVVGAVEKNNPDWQIRLFIEKGFLMELIWNSPHPPKKRGSFG